MRFLPMALVLAAAAPACKGNEPDPVESDTDTDTDTDADADADADADSDADTDTGGNGITCVEDAQEPNNDLATAIASTGGTNLAVCGGNSDFWSFSLPDGQTATITVEFIHADGDVDLNLYDGAQVEVASAAGIDDSEIVTYTNASGAAQTMILEVFGFGGDENFYDFTIVVAP